MKRYAKGHKHAKSTSRPRKILSEKENTAPSRTNAGRGTKSRRTGATTTNRRPAKSAPRRSQPKNAPVVSAATEETMAELQTTIENLAKERNFYFNKLREVEILCRQLADSKTVDEAGIQTPSADTEKLCNDVLEILYKEDDDFVAPAAVAEQQQ